MATIPLLHVQRVDSTQALARAEIASGRLAHAHGPGAFVADEQTGGVGRFGRAWASPIGGLWCTLACPLTGDPRATLGGLGLRLGVACTEFVRSLVPDATAQSVRLKWPNDVLIGERKVLGVLAEYLALAEGAWVLVGVGLNANFPASALPAPLQATATTLLDAAGLRLDLSRAGPMLMGALHAAVPPEPDPVQTVARARALLHGVGRAARITIPGGGRIDATLIGLDASGDAVVESDGSRWALPGGAVVESA